MTHHTHRLATFLAATVLGTTAAAGQAHIELTPFVGGFIPTSSLGSLPIPGPGGSSVSSTVEMKTSGAFGARVSVGGGGRFGFEGEYFFAASDMRVSFGPFPAVFDGKVQGGAGKVTYRATSEGSGTDLSLALGLGAVSHGGVAFRLAADQLDVAAVAGGGLRVTVSPLVTLRFDATLYSYSWGPGLLGFATKRQIDALATAGLAIKLGH